MSLRFDLSVKTSLDKRKDISVEMSVCFQITKLSQVTFYQIIFKCCRSWNLHHLLTYLIEYIWLKGNNLFRDYFQYNSISCF